jgi:hypothetical protein
MHERIAGYVGDRGQSKLGLTNGEWVTIGEEVGQWQTGAGHNRRERGVVWESDRIEIGLLRWVLPFPQSLLTISWSTLKEWLWKQPPTSPSASFVM